MLFVTFSPLAPQTLQIQCEGQGGQQRVLVMSHRALGTLGLGCLALNTVPPLSVPGLGVYLCSDVIMTGQQTVRRIERVHTKP